jgi:hypothetical protein
LARRGLSLLLVDVQGDTNRDVAERLRAEHGVQVVACEVDLAGADCVDLLEPSLQGRDVGLWVHCAATSPLGSFVDISRERQLATLHTNARATLLLAHRLAPALTARGRGGMVLLSSGSALSGAPWVAGYAATKGYVLALSLSLAAELESSGVDVLAVCPGLVNTAATRARPPALGRAPWVRMLEAEQVVDESLGALGERLVVVPGRAERLGLAITSRLLPRRWALAALRRSMLALYPDLGGG